MFSKIDAYPGDPILSLNEDFMKDERPSRVNLSIGVYLNEAGQLPIMHAVREARAILCRDMGASPYLPMEGAAPYRTASRALIFGTDHEAVTSDRIASIQTLGGSGALKVGADFLHRFFPAARVRVSNPTWDNHRAIFQGAGFTVENYPYYCDTTGMVDFNAMKAVLENLPAGDIVVLHACCHNPTGADLDLQQWRDLAEVFRTRRLVPFFDIAYQGFGEGMDQDAFAIRHFASLGISCLVATSFSKNFSLYGERCGSLHIVCPDATQAEKVLGQLKSTVRQNYSSPPAFGSRLVAAVLESPELHSQWIDELNAMRCRVQDMREKLHGRLCTLRPGHDFGYLLQQKGMFSFTGLSRQQVQRLREEFGVYLVGSGRICLAALTENTLTPAAEAIARVTE